MKSAFDRLNWQTVVSFVWFCTCATYALTHIPADTWERIAKVDVYALCAGIAALLGAVAAFFRKPVAKPRRSTLQVSPSYPSMSPPSITQETTPITSVHPPAEEEDE